MNKSFKTHRSGSLSWTMLHVIVTMKYMKRTTVHVVVLTCVEE